jgi:hypothetical protein
VQGADRLAAQRLSGRSRPGPRWTATAAQSPCGTPCAQLRPTPADDPAATARPARRRGQRLRHGVDGTDHGHPVHLDGRPQRRHDLALVVPPPARPRCTLPRTSARRGRPDELLRARSQEARPGGSSPRTGTFPIRRPGSPRR